MLKKLFRKKKGIGIFFHNIAVLCFVTLKKWQKKKKERKRRKRKTKKERNIMVFEVSTCFEAGILFHI